jgi:hypothetical protein
VANLTLVGRQKPVGCGGVAGSPSDVVVVDGDGAVLVLTALLEDVVKAAVEQEFQQRWIMGQVGRGAALPPNGASSGSFSAAQRACRTAARDHRHRPHSAELCARQALRVCHCLTVHRIYTLAQHTDRCALNL